MFIPATQARYQEFMDRDLEQQPGFEPIEDDEVDDRLQEVARRLAAEVEKEDPDSPRTDEKGSPRVPSPTHAEGRSAALLSPTVGLKTSSAISSPGTPAGETVVMSDTSASVEEYKGRNIFFGVRGAKPASRISRKMQTAESTNCNGFMTSFAKLSTIYSRGF